jgi:5-methylcytosine-specific restriction endonuclease McrA
MNVFVINMHGEPLMPCSPRKARLLLKEGKAKVVQREPFTIQLNSGSSGYKQDITIGVDTGHVYVGISVTTKTKELYSPTFKLRNDISKKIESRKMYRRIRRSRLRYRESRFSNKASSKKENRLAPSVQCKVDAHKRAINFYQSRLPKAKLVLECGNFDIQKIQNNNVSKDDYKKGRMYGFANTKAYVLARDNHTCQCGKGGCTSKLEVHHIKFKSQGGSDNPDNLITLCSKHHKMLHEGKLTLNVKTHRSLKSTTTMNVIRKRLLDYYPNAFETFGYITKEDRQNIGLDKTHFNDAFVIANGKFQCRAVTQEYKFKRANNRAIGINRKGFAPTSRKVRYKIQSGDIIKYEGKTMISKGNLSNGKRILLRIGDKEKAVPSKKVELLYNRKNIQIV